MAKKCGKVTVGKILARKFNVDKEKWHAVVCGLWRYLKLHEAFKSLVLPLE